MWFLWHFIGLRYLYGQCTPRRYATIQFVLWVYAVSVLRKHTMTCEYFPRIRYGGPTIYCCPGSCPLLYYNNVSIFPPGRRIWLATQRDDPNSGAGLREMGSSAARRRDSRRCWLCYFCLCSRRLHSTLAEPWARHQIGPPSDALRAIRADVMTASQAGCMLSKSSKGAKPSNFMLGAQRIGKKELTIT